VETFLSPLSVAEEKDCLIRMKNGDPSAREELILHNMRLVAHVAKRYLSSEEDPEDLISIGTIGLIKAVSTFDREYGSRFATYAIRCIDNEMLMYFRSRKKQKGEVSLYEPIGTDKEGNQIHLFDVLESEDIDVAESLEQKRQIARIRKHMTEVLTPREFEIIEKRYGLFGQREQTQREIAVATGISRSYVSRMEKKALQKLKKFLQE
jgi:RNA polymerase sporulation-specific sigma factor